MRKQWVSAGAHGWVCVDDVEFLNISEGLYGDEMTFEYKGETFVSRIVIGSRPG